MKPIRIFLTAVLSWVILLQTEAQPLNFFKDNIYNLNYNPASEVTVHQHYSLLFSHFNLQLGTNILTYNDVVFLDKQGNKVIDPKGFFARIPKSSYGEIVFNLANEFVGFGFRVNPKLYLTFSNSLRMEAAVSVPKDAFQLLSDGNMAHIGEKMTVLPLASTLLYTDYSMGLQYKLFEKMTVGIRGKLLMGMLGATIGKSDLTLMTDAEWNLHLNGSALVNLYFPKELINPVSESLNIMDIGNLFDFNSLSTKTITHALGTSWGGGFDFGVDIKLPCDFGVKASLIDVGWIKWNGNHSGASGYRLEINPNHPLYQDGELVFSGLPFSELPLTFTETTIFQLLGEVARNAGLDTALILTKVKPESYVVRTNSKLFLEGYYEMKRGKFSTLLRLDFLKEGTFPSFTLAYNFNLQKIMDVAVSYTMAKGAYRNLGLGISFNPGNFLHFYAVTDNLFTVFFPYANNNLNVQAGIYFSVPIKKPKKLEEPAP